MTAKFIVAISDPTGLMLTAKDVLDPCPMLRLGGVTEIEKSDTTSVTCVTWVIRPVVAVTVRV